LIAFVVALSRSIASHTIDFSSTDDSIDRL
jgi:hypothetical protein